MDDNARGSHFKPEEPIASREEAEAAGIPTALLDEYRGNWGLFGVWLEDKAVWGSPKTPEADRQEFSQRLRARQSLIRSTIAKLMRDKSQPEPPSEPESKARYAGTEVQNDLHVPA